MSVLASEVGVCFLLRFLVEFFLTYQYSAIITLFLFVCNRFFYSMYGDGMGQLTVTYCGYGFHCVQNLTLKTKAKNDKWQMELWKPNRPYIYSTVRILDYSSS